MEDVNYEPIKLRPRINAEEARVIANKNTKTQIEIDNEMIDSIVNKIAEGAELGSAWIWINQHWIDAKIKAYFEALGFKVEFKKGLTLMDANHWEISW